MAIEKEIKIVVDADEANKSLKQVNENLDEGTESTEQMTGALDGMTGGAVTGFKKMLGGIKTAIRGFKSLRVAIISTGIGALLIAIGSLIAYFTSSEEGANKLKVAFAAVGAVVDKLVEGFAKVGKFLAKVGGIIKDVVAGDKSLREGWNETKVAAVEMKDEIVKAYNEIASSAGKAMDLMRRENQLRKDTRTNLVEEARLRVELSEARLKTDNQTLTTVQRLEALNDAEKISNDIYNEKIRIKKEEFEIQKQRNALSDSTEDDLLKEAELQAELINLEAERNERLKENSDKRSSLIKSEADAREAETQALFEAEETRLAGIDEIREKYRLENEEADIVLEEEKILREQEKALAQLAFLNANESDQFEVKKFYADKLSALQIAKAKEQENIDKIVAGAKLDIATSTAQLLQRVLDEQSVAYKAAAVVETTISTYQSAQKSYDSLSGIPYVGPVLGGIAAALAVANGALNVQKILSTSKSSGSSGVKTSTASTGSSSSSASTRSPEFNVVSGTGTNQIAESLNTTQEPIKAYVVGSEVTSQQELDRNTVADASI